MKQTTPLGLILSGKLFARSFFLLRKPFSDCWEPRLALFVLSTTIYFTLPHPALHNDTLCHLSCFLLFNLSPCLLQQFCYHQYEHSTRRQNKNDETKTIVVLLNKFGLCWHGDLPPILTTCASQVLLRIPSSTTTNGSCQRYTISHISTMDLPSAAFSSFPSWFSQSPLSLWHLLDMIQVPTLSKSPSTKKMRWTPSTKRKPRKFGGLNAWLDLQEQEHCIIYMKEETPPFSKPHPIRFLNSSSGYTSLAPYQITAFLTSPYDDNKTRTSSLCQGWGCYTASVSWKTSGIGLSGPFDCCQCCCDWWWRWSLDSQKPCWRKRVTRTKFIREFQDA